MMAYVCQVVEMVYDVKAMLLTGESLPDQVGLDQVGIDLVGRHITDISPLAVLTNLKYLYLNINIISRFARRV